MIVYNYNKDGKYTGACECPLDPMATKRLGTPRYLIPANATLVSPPLFDPENEYAFWNGSEWILDPKEVESQEPVISNDFENRATIDVIATEIINQI